MFRSARPPFPYLWAIFICCWNSFLYIPIIMIYCSVTYNFLFLTVHSWCRKRHCIRVQLLYSLWGTVYNAVHEKNCNFIATCTIWLLNSPNNQYKVKGATNMLYCEKWKLGFHLSSWMLPLLSAMREGGGVWMNTWMKEEVKLKKWFYFFFSLLTLSLLQFTIIIIAILPQDMWPISFHVRYFTSSLSGIT